MTKRKKTVKAWGCAEFTGRRMKKVWHVHHGAERFCATWKTFGFKPVEIVIGKVLKTITP